jgi:hypothetical protein
MTGTTVSSFIADLDIWPLLVMLLPYLFLFRRRGNEVKRKRIASLSHAIIVFLITMAAGAVMSFGLSDAYLFGAVLVIAIAASILRRHVFPYQMSCPGCGRKYKLFSEDMKIVYVMDDNLCDDCRPPSE